MINYLFLAIMVLLTTAGQVLIKLAAHMMVLDKGGSGFIRSLLNRYFISGAAATFAAPVFYFLALRVIPLSAAYAFVAFLYITVFFSGWFILKEKVNRYHLIGISIVFIGVIIFHL